MALTPETGEGIANADSYVTLAEFQAYGAALGWELGDDTGEEINLRRAFHGINRNWDYIGEVVDLDQAGAFPRQGFSGIPKEIKNAQCELAYLVKGGLDLFATIDSASTSSMIKVGPITIDEETLPTGKARVVAVESLLKRFLAAGYGQARLVRA